MNMIEMAMAAKMAGGRPLPFGEVVKESDTVYWDGTTDGYVTDNFWGIEIVKVSDAHISNNDLFIDGVLREIKVTCVLPDGSVTDGYVSSADHQFSDYDYFISVTAYDGSQENVSIGFIYTDEYSREKDKGIWFIHAPEQGYVKSLTIPGLILGTTTEITPIDPKFIPGIKINKIVFSDRPTMWEWFNSQKNRRSVQSVELTQNGITAGVFNVNYSYMSNELGALHFSNVFTMEGADGALMLAMNTIAVKNTSTNVSLGVLYEAGDSFVRESVGQGNTLPDEYWAPTGTKVTVYYYSE